MLSTASNMSPLVRASHSRTLVSRALAPTGALFLRGHQFQQVRSLWFNIFPSYLEPEISRDHKVRRSLLKSKYRYMKSLSRQLSWDNPGKAHSQAAEGLDKYYMEFIAKRRGMRPPWHHIRCCNGSKTTSTESNGTSKDSGNPWMPELHSIRRYLDEQRDALASMIKPDDKNITPSGFSVSEPEYVIDPITNRKVPKHPSPATDTTIEVGKAWEKRRSKLAYLFQDLEKMDLSNESKEPNAFRSRGTPLPDELEKYRKVTIDTPTYNEELIHRVEDLPKTEPQGVPPEPPHPASEAPKPPAEIKDELEQYRKVEINYPPSMNEELIHRVEDLPQKEEPLSVPSEAEKKAFNIEVGGESTYEDLDKYKAFMNRDEIPDPNAEEVKTRSWPSRVRHLEQNIGADSSSEAAESKVKPSSPPNSILNTQAPASRTASISRRMQSASLFGRTTPTETETAMFDYDPYSKEPTGLELSWDMECASDPNANKMYVKHYSGDGTASEPVVVAPSMTSEAFPRPAPIESIRAESEASRDMHNSCQDMYGSAGYTLEKELRANQLAREEKMSSTAQEGPAPLTSGETGEPTLYKILAYDPTMQKINVAETTSVVQDASTPLSPAEVILRLSNPAKFFAHFGPLQKEGFEIVSGSGDVLVFRKVRNAVEATTPGVNPIDMMGREAVPSLGNFASPTGFVNYDYPMEDEEVTASLSRASAEGPKESSESQSTESSSKEQTAKPRKRGIVKRTVTGAAWLAGTAYGVGVVSEFAKKGSETDSRE